MLLLNYEMMYGFVYSLIVGIYVISSSLFLQSVPNSVLSSIIVVALLPLFKECFKLKHYWTINKYDFLVWIVTCLLVSFFDITIGLSVGIGLNLLTVVMDAFCSHGVTLKQCSQAGEIYQSPKSYKVFQQQSSSIKIFKYGAPLFYANVDKFKEQLFAKTDFNPVLYASQMDEVIEKIDDVEKDKSDNNKNIVLTGIHNVIQNGCNRNTGEPEVHKDVTAVVLDCSAITYTDLAALQMLSDLRSQYKVFFADRFS